PDRVGSVRQFTAVDDVHRSFGAHNGDLSRRIGEVDVRADVLRAHHAVGAAISFARDHGDFGGGRLGEPVGQLRAVADNAAEFLARAGEEAGYVLEGDQRDVEGVTETHEPRAFHRRIDIEASRQKRGLIGDDANRAAVHAREPDHDIPGEMFVYFEKLAIIHNAVDDVLHVVGQIRFRRYYRIERHIHAIGRIARSTPGRIVAIILRQIAQ